MHGPRRRTADEQKRKVELDTQHAEEDARECAKIREEAQTELDQVMPALERAEAALLSLKKEAVAEMASYRKPPTAVDKVMQAVMVLFKKEPTWASVRAARNPAELA